MNVLDLIYILQVEPTPIWFRCLSKVKSENRWTASVIQGIWEHLNRKKNRKAQCIIWKAKVTQCFKKILYLNVNKVQCLECSLIQTHDISRDIVDTVFGEKKNTLDSNYVPKEEICGHRNSTVYYMCIRSTMKRFWRKKPQTFYVELKKNISIKNNFR